MINREERRKETAEIFTPPKVVNMMLDKLPDDIWEENKTFCDPAAGNGNILLEILKRKLNHKHAPLIALKTIYGVDIMPDNIKECKERLLELIPKGLHTKAKKILDNNIVCHDALTWDFIHWRKNEIQSLF